MEVSSETVTKAITKLMNYLTCPLSLPGTDLVQPYVFVADDAFPMRTNLVKPYSKRKLSNKMLITNYRISRARRVIENSFGIMAARFRIFRAPIATKVETTISITKACVALHNYLMQHSNLYCPRKFVDRNNLKNGQWRRETGLDTGLTPYQTVHSNNYTQDSKIVRDIYCEYFNSPQGAVSWQRECLNYKEKE